MRATALMLCCCVVCVSCGRPEPAALAPAQGRVYYRGQPLAGGTIVFTPDPKRGGRGPQAWAEIDGEGRYSLRTGGRGGVAPGWHLVTVAAQDGGRLPARFRDPELSGQRVEVKADGGGAYDLHLE